MGVLRVDIEIVEVMGVKVWSNPRCHGCIFEWKEACERFGIHTRSDDTHCLFCLSNPNCVLPIKNQYKSMEAILEQAKLLSGGITVEQ